MSLNETSQTCPGDRFSVVANVDVDGTHPPNVRSRAVAAAVVNT